MADAFGAVEKMKDALPSPGTDEGLTEEQQEQLQDLIDQFQE